MDQGSDFDDEETVNPLANLLGKSLLERIRAIAAADFAPFTGQIIEEVPLQSCPSTAVTAIMTLPKDAKVKVLAKRLDTKPARPSWYQVVY